jgi:2-succinyl-5-enolpyruvyl-6-hydroxy-3-cyclohexene-1-carboxylate synthase
VNPATTLARTVVDELVACGVTDAVLCPGSRNAPLAFALHAADAAGRLRLHVRIDERTAGFLALGLALGSGRPVPVATTSGTAAANLLPAVLEAAHAGVPLLAITADRPAELVGTGASQTVAQVGMFGSAVRLAPAVGGTAAQMRAAVGRAVAAAVGLPPGPVHLNLPFREPLTPDASAEPADTPTAGAPVSATATDLTQPAASAVVAPATSAAVAAPTTPGAAAAPATSGTAAAPATGGVAAADVAAPVGPAGPVWPVGRPGRPWTAVATPRVVAAPLPLDPTAPTLVIAGPGAPPLDVGVPVVAEPSSAPWPGAVRTGPWLLGTPSLTPTQVVVAGRPTLHRAVARLLADPAVAVYALADERGLPWTDVVGSVRAVGAMPPLRPDPEWLRRWATADKAAQAALDEALDNGPTGMQLARALIAALADGTQLVLGSSNPVRDVALAAAPRDGVVVRSNRGVAGIDGTISTAVGAALGHDGPTVALLGDLTFLHDTTGLVIGPAEARPDLTIVVLDDRGGGIFHLLEQGAPEHAPAFERVFGTPHTVDLAALCAAMGVPHTYAEPADIAAHLGLPGMRVVHVRGERSGLRNAHAALRARIAAAVGA